MQLLIETRNRAAVSMAATDMRLEDLNKQQKERPASAPVTKHESDGARLSAGETDLYTDRQTAMRSASATPKPRLLHISEQGDSCDIDQSGENVNQSGMEKLLASAL